MEPCHSVCPVRSSAHRANQEKPGPSRGGHPPLRPKLFLSHDFAEDYWYQRQGGFPCLSLHELSDYTTKGNLEAILIFTQTHVGSEEKILIRSKSLSPLNMGNKGRMKRWRGCSSIASMRIPSPGLSILSPGAELPPSAWKLVMQVHFQYLPQFEATTILARRRNSLSLQQDNVLKSWLLNLLLNFLMD